MSSRMVGAHAAAVAAALSAGGAVVATRFVIGETDPLTLVFLRYAIAVVCFLPILPRLWPREGLSAPEVGKIAAFGVMFFVLFPWAFNASLQHVPAARGAVGLATIPVQTMIISALLRRETITRAKLTGVLTAFGGILIAFGPAAFRDANPGFLLGDSLMLLGVACAALYSVLGRPTLMRHGPLFVTALGMAFAVLALLPIVTLSGGLLALPSFTARGWMTVVFLGTVAGAVQFSLFMWALRWLPPTTTVLYLTLNPLAAMVLGAALLGENLTASLVVGMALVLTGILVAAGLVTARGRAGPVVDRQARDARL